MRLYRRENEEKDEYKRSYCDPVPTNTGSLGITHLIFCESNNKVKGLLKEYKLPGLLDKLDVIECFEQPGRSLRVGKMVEKKEDLYYALGVKPPASL